MKKARLKKVIYKILYLLMFIKLMGGIQVYAAELDLEPKYGSGNPYKFEISNTWTSEGDTIKSYDVSEQGQIAIAFSNYTIGVFDNNMNFLYQLSFETNGTYGVLWLNEKLLFIEIRSETAIVCDKNGMPEKFYKIIGPSNYINKVVDKRLRIQGNDQYYSVKKGGSNTPDSLIYYGYYTMLKRTTREGWEEVLYEADTSLDMDTLMQCSLFILILVVNVIMDFAIYAYKKRTDKKNE